MPKQSAKTLRDWELAAEIVKPLIERRNQREKNRTKLLRFLKNDAKQDHWRRAAKIMLALIRDEITWEEISSSARNLVLTSKTTPRQLLQVAGVIPKK